MENISTRLINKSTEAFILGLEIYNNPTIRYKWTFFVCNAWELMLKAYLINRDGVDVYIYPTKKCKKIKITPGA